MSKRTNVSNIQEKAHENLSAFEKYIGEIQEEFNCGAMRSFGPNGRVIYTFHSMDRSEKLDVSIMKKIEKRSEDLGIELEIIDKENMIILNAYHFGSKDSSLQQF